MKSKRYMPHLATLCLLLTMAIILLSWILDAYGVSAIHPQTGEEVRVQSLLRPEGIRRMLRSVVDNFIAFPLTGWSFMALMGVGVALHSGFPDACHRLRRGRKFLSHKERRSLASAAVMGIAYVSLILFATFSPWAILRNAGDGLAHSPFLDGMPFLLSLGIGLLGGVYGFTSGHYRTDGDVVEGMTRLISRCAAWFVILFFMAQTLACLTYSGLDRYLYAWLSGYLPH